MATTHIRPTRRTIYKYQLKPQCELGSGYALVELAMPAGAKVLHVADVDGELFAWASVDPDMPSRAFTFAIVPTGGSIPERSFSATHLGTVIQETGLVWHVFQL